MKTDKLFYRLFQVLPVALFELIGASPAFAGAYQFVSVELKELARTIDGIFLPGDEAPEEPIYFLEVQFQEDDDLYRRLMTEVFLYLGQYKPGRKWRAVVVWAKRSLDPGIPIEYESALVSNQIVRVYLNELDVEGSSSVGLGIARLAVASQKKAETQVRSLVQRARQEITDDVLRRDVIELIEKAAIYKFPQKSSKELQAMFGTTEWEQTRFYQEVSEKAKLEGKLETVPRFLKKGLTVQEIAEALELDLETVQKAAKEQSSN